MIRVLVADDSDTARAIIVDVLRSDPDMEVVGEARDGREAVELSARLEPDVITMDIIMPGMDGFEATQKIMASRPVPIIIVSALPNLSEGEAAARALTVGALTVLRKPPSVMSPDFKKSAAEMLNTVKVMSKVLVDRPPDPPPGRERQETPRVVRRRVPPIAEPPVGGSRATVAPAVEAAAPEPAARETEEAEIRCEVVAIAASTGGPAALLSVLSNLPKEFPAPILVVQHMTPGFMNGLAGSLAAACPLTVKVAEDGEPLRGGTVYLAPDGHHLGIGAQRTIELSTAARIKTCRPSATHLFDTVAAAFPTTAACVVLSGATEDGVDGLRSVKQAGGAIIVQDEATSVVFDMPGAVVKAGLADAALPLSVIPRVLWRLCHPETARGDH